MTTRRDGAVERQLQSAVNWKVFEVQAVLVGGNTADEEVSTKQLEQGIQWLQPRHYEEVVKERANEGRCGYPLCLENIRVPRSDAEGAGAVYHINMKNQDVEDGRARLYFCQAPGSKCMVRSNAYQSNLADTMPASRECVRSLDLAATPGRVDDILQTLSFHDASDEDSDENDAEAKSRGKDRDKLARQAQRAKAAQNRGRSPQKTASTASTAGVSVVEDAERAAPPDYGHSKLLHGGAVQPKYWNVRNLDEKAARVSISETQSEPQTSSLTQKNNTGGAAGDPDARYAGTTPSVPSVRSAGSMKATALLESLRTDPTKLGLLGITPQPAAASPSSRSPGKGKSVTAGPSAVDVKAAPKKATPTKKGGDEKPAATAEVEADAVMHPSMHPSMTPSFAPSMNPADIKGIKPSNREKSLRDKYKAGNLPMQMLGSGPASKKGPTPAQAAQAVATEAAHAAAGNLQYKDEEKKEEEEVKEKEPQPLTEQEEADAAAELAEYENRHATGGANGFSSWRDERLDTSVDTRTTQMLLGAKPSGASVPPRVRMNPKGVRAKALHEKNSPDKTDAIHSPAIVKEKLILGDEATEDERRFLEGINEEGDQPKATYDNNIVATKIREVEWKEPDQHMLSSQGRLKPVGSYAPPKPINKMAVKQSMFKKQREAQRERAALGPDPSDRVGDNSSGAKTVKWAIKETDAPKVMPESSISTKHGDEYELKDGKAPAFSRGPRNESIEAMENNDNDGDDNEVWEEEEDPQEKEEREKALVQEEIDHKENELKMQHNREVRRQFFSSSGISAVIIPQGLSSGAEASNIGNDSKDKSAAAGAGDLSVEDLENAIDDGLVSEPYEESDDGAGEFSEDSSDDLPVLPTKKPSTFFVLWTALDDLLSHTGKVIKRLAPTSSAERAQASKNTARGREVDTSSLVAVGRNTDDKDTADRQEAKSSVNISMEYTNSLMLSNPERVTSGGGKSHSIHSFVSRGIATSEMAVGINSLLAPTQLAEYYYTKRRVLGLIDAGANCPPLSSSGWAFFGLLIIDGIVRHRNLMRSDDSNDSRSSSSKASDSVEWEPYLQKFAPLHTLTGIDADADSTSNNSRKAKGDSTAKMTVDNDELRVLRSFFDDL